MNYEDMSDFEVNKAVSDIVHLNLFQLDSDGRGVFVSKSTDKYDFVNIVHSNFDPCNNPSDIMPIAIEYGISIEFEPLSKYSEAYILHEKNKPYIWVKDKNPYRAIAICFLKMMDAEK